MTESDRQELEARRKGYIQDGVYVKLDIDARVITKEAIKTWATEDLEIIRDTITEVIKEHLGFDPATKDNGRESSSPMGAGSSPVPAPHKPEYYVCPMGQSKMSLICPVCTEDEDIDMIRGTDYPNTKHKGFERHPELEVGAFKDTKCLVEKGAFTEPESLFKPEEESFSAMSISGRAVDEIVPGLYWVVDKENKMEVAEFVRVNDGERLWRFEGGHEILYPEKENIKAIGPRVEEPKDEEFRKVE